MGPDIERVLGGSDDDVPGGGGAVTTLLGGDGDDRLNGTGAAETPARRTR